MTALDAPLELSEQSQLRRCGSHYTHNWAATYECIDSDLHSAPRVLIGLGIIRRFARRRCSIRNDLGAFGTVPDSALSRHTTGPSSTKVCWYLSQGSLQDDGLVLVEMVYIMQPRDVLLCGCVAKFAVSRPVSALASWICVSNDIALCKVQ